MTNPMQTGNEIAGVAVTPSMFQGVTSLNQAENFGLLQPSQIEGTTKLQAARKGGQVSAAKDTRDAVQRTFNKARLLRAEVYSAYIEQVEVGGQYGGPPAVTLYSSVPAQVNDSGLLLAYGTPVIAIDGETQTEARYLLRDRLPETGNAPFGITMYHGIDDLHAQQILHDYNRYGLRVSERQTAAFNHVGPLSKAVANVLGVVGMLPENINRRGAVSTKKTVASNVQIMAALTGHAMGTLALKKPATSWFGELNQPTSQQVINSGAEFDILFPSA